MKFILSIGWEEGIADLTKRLAQELSSGKKVLWLVTGGSNIEAAVTIMNSISEGLSQHLTVMLADERYGAVGHPDSNWQQLLDSGFDGKKAKLLPLLREGDSFEAAHEHYNSIAVKTFKGNDVVIAQVGIGTDGHILGILPHSPAANDTEELVAAYTEPNFQRLTLTFKALDNVDVDYSFAFGEGKRLALQALQHENLEPSVQPAQALKKLPEVYIYNDQIGEPA